MAILTHLQQSLETLHDIQTDLNVETFIVADQAGFPGAKENIPEQLFVYEQGESVELALYIAPHIVQELTLDNPQIKLHAGNLENYCIALEGVSHFVFYAWCANLGRQITALELELQAEVDKFVLSWLLLEEQGLPLYTTHQNLINQLFASYTLRENLPAEEVERYQAANDAALRFCKYLAQRFAQCSDKNNLKQVIRSYFRQSLDDKLRA